MNQCDGCRAGWPVNASGNHYNPSPTQYANLMACTKERYMTLPERLCYAATSRPGGICEEAANEIERLNRAIEIQANAVRTLRSAEAQAAVERDFGSKP